MRSGFIVQAATTGENDGFTQYMWEKPDVEGLVLKRAYSQLFEPWNYIVSTGNYMDALVLAKKTTYDEALISRIMTQVVTLIILFILYAVITFIFSGRISKNLTAIGKHVKEIADQTNLLALNAAID